MRYFSIGGWKLQYNELAGNKTECEFTKRLHEYSLDYCGYADISITNKIRTYTELLITAPNDLPIYEKSNGPFTNSVYWDKPDGYFWVTWIKPGSVFLAYSIDSTWRKACLLSDHTNTNVLEVFEHLADIFAYSAITLGGIVLHGVVMDYQGQGVILSAPSGTGKTTHANIWCNLGFSTIINGDRALCRCTDGTWTAFGIPWCGTSGIAQNRQVPIQAIVVLEQHCENIVKRLSPLEALTRLLPNIFAPKWEPSLYHKMLDRLDEIIPAVPIFLLQCRPDEDAAFTLKSALDRL